MHVMEVTHTSHTSYLPVASSSCLCDCSPKVLYYPVATETSSIYEFLISVSLKMVRQVTYILSKMPGWFK